MNEELMSLVRENNAMLKRIIAYIEKVESPSFRDNKSFEDFMSNLVANIIYARFECGNNLKLK